MLRTATRYASARGRHLSHTLISHTRRQIPSPVCALAASHHAPLVAPIASTTTRAFHFSSSAMSGASDNGSAATEPPPPSAVAVSAFPARDRRPPTPALLAPVLHANALQRKDHGDVEEAIVEAHTRMQEMVARLDASVTEETPAVRARQSHGASQLSNRDSIIPASCSSSSARLKQWDELLRYYLQSPIFKSGTQYAGPSCWAASSDLRAYWSQLLCAVLAHRWWPSLLAQAQPSSPILPADETTALLQCAKTMPLPLQARLLVRAIHEVMALPHTVVDAYQAATTLAPRVSSTTAAAAGGDAVALVEEHDLVQASLTALRTLIRTPVPGLTDSVRPLAILPEQMLDAADALVLAVVQSVTVRTEGSDDPAAPLHAALAEIVPQDAEGNPTLPNQMLASHSNPAAWARWQQLVAHLSNPSAAAAAAATTKDKSNVVPLELQLAKLGVGPQLRNPAKMGSAASSAPASGSAAASFSTRAHPPTHPQQAAAAAVVAAPQSHSAASAAPAASSSASSGGGGGGGGHLPPAFVSALTTELLQWYHSRALSPPELRARESLLDQLQSLVNQLDPGLRVELFGSAAARTAMKGSDMDVALFTAGGKVVDNPPKSFLSSLTKLIRKSGQYIRVQPILHARVPIISFVDRRSQIAIDLSFGQGSTPYKSRLLRAYTSLDPRVAQLIAVVKNWAGSHGLNDASQGTLNSFGYALLVIQYLQILTPPILPSLQVQTEAIQREERDVGLPDKLEQADPALRNAVHAKAPSTTSVRNNNEMPPPHSPFVDRVALVHPQLHQFHASPHEQRVWMREHEHDRISEPLSSSSAAASGSPPLGALFIGFLHFYSHIYRGDQHVVNIRAGGLCDRRQWVGDFKFSNGPQAGLAVADPFDLGDNVARAVKAQTWALIQKEMGVAIRALQGHRSYAFITGDSTRPQYMLIPGQPTPRAQIQRPQQQHAQQQQSGPPHQQHQQHQQQHHDSSSQSDHTQQHPPQPRPSRGPMTSRPASAVPASQRIRRRDRSHSPRSHMHTAAGQPMADHTTGQASPAGPQLVQPMSSE